MYSIIRRHLPSVVVLICLLFGLASCEAERSGDTRAPVRVEAAVTTAPESVPETMDSPRFEVTGEMLPYAEHANQLAYAYFAFPVEMIDPVPAVILIHDWWGLDEAIRSLSRRLAGEGYIVMAIDLFGGVVANSSASARILEDRIMDDPQVAAENIRQAYKFVDESFHAPKIASLGLGFGGYWSLNAAVLLPGKLDASVMFYGEVITDDRKLASIQTPLLGLFAERDRVVTVTSVRQFEQALQSIGKNVEIELFEGAGRGFADEKSRNFNAETAARAWVHTVEFLAQHLESD